MLTESPKLLSQLWDANIFSSFCGSGRLWNSETHEQLSQLLSQPACGEVALSQGKMGPKGKEKMAKEALQKHFHAEVTYG